MNALVRSKANHMGISPLIRKRHPRRPITGLSDGWQVNSAGIIYRFRRVQPITKHIGGLPTIGLDKNYRGPVPPAGGDTTEDDGDTERLLDEIVCFEFHGYPRSFVGSLVQHLDGDDNNCEADNLRWLVDDEYAEAVENQKYRRFMRPDFLPNRVVRLPVRTRPSQQTLYVNSDDIPGYLPVPAIRKEN